jgi:hypothetical protein
MMTRPIAGDDCGAFASLTYNGYGYFDGDEFCDWVSELGRPKPPDHRISSSASRAAAHETD